MSEEPIKISRSFIFGLLWVRMHGLKLRLRYKIFIELVFVLNLVEVLDGEYRG